MSLKLNHWTYYVNLLMLISPPFFAFYLSHVSAEPRESMVLGGLLYFVVFIVILMSKVTGLLDEVKQLKKDLKQCKGEPVDEEITGDEPNPDS